MYMQPAVRKGLIIEPASAPFVNYQDPICVQDDLVFPDFSQEASLQCIDQQQPRLQSPFQYHPHFQFVSPPSSAPSSPSSSPASSISHLPVSTAIAADYPSAVFDGNSLEAPSMTPASSYNPSYHFQPSASPPVSQPYLHQYPHQYLFNSSPMLTQQPVANNPAWEGNLLLNPARIPNNVSRTAQYPQNSHPKTSSSSSSSRSAPAGSSYQRSSNGVPVSKPLPTPVQTPVQNSFLSTTFQNYDPSSHDGSHPEAEISMRRAIVEQQQKQHQQQPSSDYSLPASVSSVSHNSPVTPQTNIEELDDASKSMVHGEKYPVIETWMDDYLHLDFLPDYSVNNGNNMSVGIPKLNRTISDIYQDELYNPMMPMPQVSKPTTNNQQNLLTPYRNVFADRLQAANQGHMSARSQSPTSGINRGRSPFRQNSPLAAEYNNAALQQPQMATSIPVSHSAVNAGQSQGGQGESNTMSPKDALLDFHEGEENDLSLFQPNQSDFNLSEALGLRRDSSSSFPQAQNFTSMESFPSQYTTQGGMNQQYPFTQQQQDRQQPPQQNDLLHQTPEFPASLPNFDSTGSDVLPSTEIPSPQAQSKVSIHPVTERITRPENTSADSGTYTCTYHGCTLRFETPAKLQKHKREAHRQTTPGGHLVGRDTSSRNSQAGPHKYTIHNARKQKVRCHLCTEEKTFSRNDALTRHMRVVHPEVDWPGKQRRKGRD
ncbi:hypothetical protein EYZ11_000071 [Aspergillus tanneri]|uniref:C2H2-type domain-containing protein n=1 Tax=Aspergillus tanneri TaxID=1220188 RepID=A0A4S3JY63_9EURO|nr:hypothetical protein EYZ11_000071 [Aspergillus tanneri]